VSTKDRGVTEVPDNDEETGQKKQSTPGQPNTVASLPRKDITAIEQQVDLKYLELIKNKLPLEEPYQEQRPEPQQQSPVSSSPLSQPPHEEQTSSTPVSPQEKPIQPQTEGSRKPRDEPQDILQVPLFDEPDFQEEKKHISTDTQVKIKKRLGFGRRVRKTKLQLDQYTDTISQAVKKQDLRGELVFSEESGEKLGVITDTVYDEAHHVIGYKIKTDDAMTSFSFPVEQFIEEKQGMLLISNWYRNALETIEKLEFYEKISPELSSLVKDGGFNEELYHLLIKRDEEFANDLDDTLLLKEIIVSQTQLFKERRMELSEKAQSLVSKRLIEDVDRTQFSEDVQELRRKVKLLDLNIQKCNSILQRLKNTSLGTITQYITENDEDYTEDRFEHERKPSNTSERRPREIISDDDPTLTELIAELVKEIIADDLKKQLRQNKTSYHEEHRAQSQFDNDEEKSWGRRRQELLRKRRQHFR
jgi:hypothetical protein